ncbi:MAG: hypothetical protein IPL61_04730 [Myxococcales bacterium]|nr:hypothetical protein [Myxococcales bacterium]
MSLDAAACSSLVRQFPDGECYVRLDGDVAGREVVVVGGLDRPAERLPPTLFLAATAKDLGARGSAWSRRTCRSCARTAGSTPARA